MPRYSQRQRAALDTLMKEEVHRHAVRIIESEGLHALTLERLAKGIGVSRGTLYNYFADRDDIIDFVEHKTFEPLLERLQEISGGAEPPAERLRAILEEIFAGVRRNLALVVALSPEKFTSRDRKRHIERHRQGLALLRRIIEDGIASGEFRALPADQVSASILATITGIVDNMSYGTTSRKPEEMVPVLMDLLLGGLTPPATAPAFPRRKTRKLAPGPGAARR